MNQGLFSQPSYISIGDEYDKKIAISDRSRGNQFKTAPLKKGNTVDVLFEKQFKSLHLGDKYLEPGTIERKFMIEKAKKKLTPEGFRYSSPPKKSCGLGNYYGCFNERAPFKHETEYVVVKKGELPSKVQPQLKNIVTCPAKKGTYGFPGLTIGKGDEYKYISDPYDVLRRRDAQQSKENKLLAGAFKSACKRLDYFDSQPNVAASKIYSLDKPLPARKPEPPKKEPAITVPFKPSSPAKRGFAGTINKFPEYKEDPYELKEKAERETRSIAKPGVVWKPVSGPRSMYVRSIAFSKTGP